MRRGSGVRGQEFLDRDHEGRERGLHVAGAAAVELAVAVRGREGRAGPLLERAGGHHVGVAGEDHGAARRGSRAGAGSAHRLVTRKSAGPLSMVSSAKPSRARRSPRICWQPRVVRA